jgi:hypothetical protein
VNPPADHRPPFSSATWFAFAASVRGASHESTGTPNQDSVMTSADRVAAGEPLVVAVADGHGDPRHFRSARGSYLATSIAGRIMESVGGEVGRVPDADAVRDLLHSVLVPELKSRWDAAVRADTEAYPFTPKERDLLRTGDTETTPYGSTVLLAGVSGRWLCLTQVGDGDIVVVDPSGSAGTPLPPDPAADGRRTTSLCSPGVEQLFRCTVIDLSSVPVSLVLLATDGFGNAQSEEPWHPSVGRDIAKLLAQNGVEWIGDHLFSWGARCASSEGSGDDTSLGLLVRGEATGEVR